MLLSNDDDEAVAVLLLFPTTAVPGYSELTLGSCGKGDGLAGGDGLARSETRALSFRLGYMPSLRRLAILCLL